MYCLYFLLFSPSCVFRMLKVIACLYCVSFLDEVINLYHTILTTQFIVTDSVPVYYYYLYITILLFRVAHTSCVPML